MSSFFTSVFVKEGDTDEAPEPDVIHPTVLKKMAKIVVLPQKLIFNRSMLSNKLSLEWKSANISQSLRKGVKVNYRPVSLTAIPCKIDYGAYN